VLGFVAAMIAGMALRAWFFGELTRRKSSSGDTAPNPR
jgi:hypothetical protein